MDVAVYGPSAAGALAAVAAASQGASVALLGPQEHVGGMVSSGLGWTDFGRTDVIGGLVRRFYQAVAEHYGAPVFSLKGPEPHVAEQIFLEMLEAARAQWYPATGLESVEKHGATITSVCAGADRARFEAGIFVDASYEGDLMAAAGASYRVGREPRSLHGEQWAGCQPAYRPGYHNFDVLVSPFYDGGELLAEVKSPELDERGWPREDLGEGDGGLQAYQLRLCLTDDLDNQLPLEEPLSYDPERFEALRRYLQLLGDKVSASRLIGLVPGLLPGSKCDVNSIGPFSLNVLDGTNRGYPEGDKVARAAIYEHHRRYSHELLWFLRTGDGVPESVRGEVRRWSLCADEFVPNGGWPHQMYVREARRLVGRYVLTEHDLLRPGPQPDDVAAYGSYNIDIREVQRTWRYLPEYTPQPALFNEGYLSLPVAPYPIPLRCLLPQPGEVDNLFVPVCCSASQVAYGSVRTEPTLMALGEAAGREAASWARAGAAPGHAL